MARARSVDLWFTERVFLARCNYFSGVRVLVTSGLVLAGMLPASANAALKVTKAGPAPVVLAQGGSVSVKASARGGSGKLAIVLAAQPKSASGGVVLTGKGARVRGSAKGVKVRGTVPASLPAGQRRYVLVCTSAAKAVAGKKASCKSAGAAPTSAGTLDARLAAATAAGALKGGRDALYAVWALTGDPRLPDELRGAAPADGSQSLVRAAAANFASYSPAVKKQLAWYFAPPTAPGSPWAQQLVKKKPKHAVRLRKGPKMAKAAAASRVAFAAKAANCAGYNYLSDSPYSEGYKSPWVGIPTSDGHAIVWYQEGEAPAKKTAEQYAQALPGIWQKLTSEFGAPLSDAKMECYAGPDARFDVYVNGALTFQAAGGLEGGRSALGTHGVTMPYPSGKGQWCTGRPSWIALRAGETTWALAHEFMHAIQFAHRYASCGEPISWWDEGSATWAADYVYPASNEERQFGDWVNNPLGQANITDAGYRAYPFFMFLQRTQGTGVLRAIFEQLRSKGSIAAIDAAIPGGYAQQWPTFAIEAWNQSPIGEGGLPISQSFKDWDSWSTSPAVPASPDLTLDGSAERTIDLPIQNAAATAPLSIAAYQRVKISDEKIREIKFTNNATAGGAHVQAMLHLRSGDWKLDDWTGHDKTLCRDNDDEDVTELIIVTTNASGTGTMPSFTHKLRGRDQCEPATFRITSYEETRTSDTARGHTEVRHVQQGPGDPVVVEPCPDGPDFCNDPGEVWTELPVTVTSTVDGYVTGAADPQLCPGGRKTFPTQTLTNPEALQMQFDPRGKDGDASFELYYPTVAVGGIDVDYCAAYTYADGHGGETKTVPRKQVLSGQPFTVSASRSETVPATQGASATITYSWTLNVTMVRVNADGSPYSG